MSQTEPDGGRRAATRANGDGPRRRAATRKGHTVRNVLLASLLVLALVTGLSVVYVFRHLDGNLTGVDLSAQIKDRATKVEVAGDGQPINVLVMGSDSREGENNIDGLTGDGERSDTTILLHVSADRTRAYGISIPRDSMVERPDCGKSDEITGGRAMWNAAFTFGGPACTIEQFESLTGIYVDHWVKIDFAGFKDMVDAIDGVPVCIPEPGFIDNAHGINLPPGEREISGKQALSYVRVRHIEGTDGSDISRLKRQQAFMASMVNKVVSAGTLTRPDRVVGFLSAATQSLEMDKELASISDLTSLALQLNKVGLDKIKFLTIPNEYLTGEDRGRVGWKEPEAAQVWEKIRLDEPLTKKQGKGALKASKPSGDKSMTAEERAANGFC